jgi:hypothetical protein
MTITIIRPSTRQQSDGPAPSPEWWAEYAAANRGRVRL